MNLEEVVRELRTIERVLEPLLEEPSKRALQIAWKPLQERIETEKKSKRAKVPWSYSISPAEPVRFMTCPLGKHVKHALTADIFAQVSEPTAGQPAGAHNIAVRVWSSDPELWFRNDLDAEVVRERCRAKNRRVMLRFHFDHAEAGQNGPRDHLQIGGIPDADEVAWLPKNWKLPRFAHYPVSLLMVCDLVVRNFFPASYQAVSAEPSWKACMSSAQKAYLVPYLKTLPFVQLRSDFDKSLGVSCLSHWWNISL